MSKQHLTLGSQQPEKVEGKSRLYSMEYCPFAHRVRLILRFKNVEHDTVNINLINKPEWYSKIHPEGKVPALDNGNEVIVESLDICEHLNEKYPNPPLYPAEPSAIEEEKALISKISAIAEVLMKILMGKEEKDAKEWKDEFMPHIELFENELKKRGTKYFGGDNPGMLDFMLWPWAERAGAILIVLGERLPLANDELSKIREWRKVMREHPVVDGIYNGPEKFYKSIQVKLGILPPDYDAI